MAEAAGGGRGRRRRLSRSAEFERVYRQGRSKANRFLVLYAFPREEGSEEGPRLGLLPERLAQDALHACPINRATASPYRDASAARLIGHA